MELGSNHLLGDLFENYDSIVVFDVETSGLDPYKDQIVELGAHILNRGRLRTSFLQCYIRLYGGRRMSQEAMNVNHITEKLLLEKGVTIQNALIGLQKLIGTGRALLVAHNANFDMLFLRAAALEAGMLDYFNSQSVLDTLTVYKDRAPYPHKLSDAIVRYHLEGRVKNSHGAADDAKALLYVLLAMDKEKNDLANYINLIGYNPKYPPKYKLKNVTYLPQPYGATIPLYHHTEKKVNSNFLKLTENGQENQNNKGDAKCAQNSSSAQNMDINPNEVILSPGPKGWVIEKYRGFDKPEMLIPSVIDGKKVVSIGPRAFRNCMKVETLYIEDGITAIEECAFSKCISLKEVLFPNTLQTIGTGAFGGCCALHDVIFPNSLAYIGAGAFSGCLPLHNVILGNTKVKTIHSRSFFGCDIEKLVLPQLLGIIESEAFGIYGVDGRNPDIFRFSPENIIIPDRVTELRSHVFLFWPARNPVDIYIPESVLQINDDAFAVARSYSGLTKFFRCDQIIIHCGPATTALDFAREKGYRVEEWSRVSDETTQSQYNSFLASRMAADINLPDYCDIHAEDFPVEKNDEDADESEFDEVADEGVDPFDYRDAHSVDDEWYDYQDEIDEELDESFYIGDGDD